MSVINGSEEIIVSDFIDINEILKKDDRFINKSILWI